ncbi:universal stress protein [Glycomyces halotolerans]
MALQGQGQRRIVVGVDGSPSSIQALKWALTQAEATDSTVEAVRTWEIPTDYGMAAIMFPGEGFAEAAQEALAEAVEKATGGQPNPRLEQKVVEGHAADALLKQAELADLLVVGSRGHGGFVGALLGSVSQYCIQHAKCPVVVVRAE